MRATVRIPRALLAAMRLDLTRPHDHALERVGFLIARCAQHDGGMLLLATDYAAVADVDYIPDSRVGARINSHAIRSALQRALTSGNSLLHTHAHEHSGTPGFSGVDVRTLVDLVPSFRAVAPRAPQGGVVLSHDRAAARLWLPGEHEPVGAKMVFVGWPLGVCGVTRPRAA
jgi:hypothetical protein